MSIARRTVCFTALLGTLAAHALLAAAQAPPATPAWRRLQTPDLTLAGAVPDDVLRRVSAVLRRFRDAVEPVLPGAAGPPALPTTVIVLSGQWQMAPFASSGTAAAFQAGLFVGGMTSNYILLTAGERDDDYAVAYHEYVHLITRQHVPDAPAWFHEGLAEYFRTFSIAPDGTATVGGDVAGHLELLRRRGLMPLASLLSVDFDSAAYNQHDTASIFYAQSWLLVHYLMTTEHGGRVRQLASFLAQLVDDVPPEQASLAAFGMTLGALEDGLQKYLAQASLARQQIPAGSRRGASGDISIQSMSEADAHTLVGDVLLTMQRYDRAQDEFSAALLADPESARAHAGLGRLLAQQGFDEPARAHLERAVAARDASWETLVTYAAALFSLRPTQQVDAAGPDDRAIEQALRRAIALAPSRPAGYAHLARLLSLDSQRLAEARRLVASALKLAPGDEELQLINAAVLVNGMEYAAARPLLEALTGASSASVREQAGRVLGEVDALLAQTAGRTAEEVGLVPPPVRPRKGGIALFRVLQAGEHRDAGRLAAIECLPNGLVVVLQVPRGTLRLSARSIQEVEFVNHSQRTGPVQCGAALKGTVVVVSYVPASSGATNGRLTALEFAPEGYTPAGR
jgi:tetratricopeptide (TPR) repeat protein